MTEDHQEPQDTDTPIQETAIPSPQEDISADQEAEDTNQETDAPLQESDIPTPQEGAPANQEAEDTATGQKSHIVELEKRLKSANSEAATRRQKQREAEARIEGLEAEVERIHQERREERISNFINRIGIPSARNLFPEYFPLEDFSKEANRVEDLVAEIITDWLKWDRTSIKEDILYNTRFNVETVNGMVGNVHFLAEIGLDQRPDKETIQEAIMAYDGPKSTAINDGGWYPAGKNESDPANRVMDVFNKKS